MEKAMKYEAAVAELEQIVKAMESGDMDLDMLTVKLKRAQELVKLCHDKLAKTDAEIRQLLDSENKNR